MLSEIMPDIAIPSGPDLTIATAPPINQMLLREPELLGDDHHHRRHLHHRGHGHSHHPSPDKSSKKSKGVLDKDPYTQVWRLENFLTSKTIVMSGLSARHPRDRTHTRKFEGWKIILSLNLRTTMMSTGDSILWSLPNWGSPLGRI